MRPNGDVFRDECASGLSIRSTMTLWLNRRLPRESHGESRFQSMDDSDAKAVNCRLGWRKGAGADREWWVPPECWKAEICAGLDPQFVARALAERGMLRRQGGNVLQCTVNVGGGQRVRAYVLTAAILEGGGDAS